MKTSRLVPAAVAIVAGAALSAGASPTPTAIFTNIQSSPTSDVPGLPGFKFNPGTGVQFDRPFVSANGQRWAFRAIVDDPTADKDIIISAMVPSSAGATIVALEGDPVFFDPSRTYTLFRTTLGINNAGVVAFSGDISGGTTDDEFVARWAGGVMELIAREGVQAIGQAPGVGYGTLSNGVNILDDEAATVCFRSSGFTGATTQQALFCQESLTVGVVLAQTDITVPGNQRIAPDQSLDALTSDRFSTSADGSNTLYHADLNGPTATDLVMVYNGEVLAQEGTVVSAEFSSPILNLSGDAGSQRVSPANGHYIFRGSNADGGDWVMGRGGVLAAKGWPITLNPGETEHFDDATYAALFFSTAINSAGDRVIGGVTDAANLGANAVLVFNGQRVIAREGDGVDIDGNGQADDDAYISVFNNDDAALTDDGWFIFMADLVNGGGTSIGQAIMRIRICKPDWNADAAVNSNDISAFLSSWLASIGNGTLLADYNNDGAVNSNDISAFLSGWLSAVAGGC